MGSFVPALFRGSPRQAGAARQRTAAQCQPSGDPPMTEPFKGVIKLDVRDSKPDWAPYALKKAPEGAPNVLIVLFDDTGLAAWSPFGGRINMPTLQKLADN